MFQIKLIVIYKVMMPLTFFPARIIPSLKLSNYSWLLSVVVVVVAVG